MNVDRCQQVVVAAVALLVSLTAGAVQAEPPAVGDQVPDFTLPDLDGTVRTLSEQTGEGPVVLIFFRGAW